MLTEVEEGMSSGIRNIEWDAVELPSQFMVRASACVRVSTCMHGGREGWMVGGREGGREGGSVLGY
jgi:hypothetical protein